MTKPKEENPILKYLWIKPKIEEIKEKLKERNNETTN